MRCTTRWPAARLFWDGASFLVNLLDHGRFHDFYAARAHVDWVTQAPVLLLAQVGVRDMQAAGAWPTRRPCSPCRRAFYHLALMRVRRRSRCCWRRCLPIVAAVYLPTSFFIVGEYNVAYAALTAVMAIALTTDGRSRWDAAMLLGLRPLCLRQVLRER